MTWLEPNTVPTFGNYLKANSYGSHIRGKWHVSDSGIRLNDNSYLLTYDKNGKRLRDNEQFYLDKNPLGPYGFDGWIGPEPHGSTPLNSASSVPPPTIGRDEKYTEQLLEVLDDLILHHNPWHLMATYVDPHDIAIYGLYAKLSGEGFEFESDPTLPQDLFLPEFNVSHFEDLLSKPPAQKSYRDLYRTALQPIINIKEYFKYYYTIQKRVDENLYKVWSKLKRMPYFDNTVVIFTSDHGELLGAHGRMHQKWHQAYEEALRVPMMISDPRNGRKKSKVYDLTSHIDILPTILDLMGIDLEKTRKKLGKDFSLNLRPVGKSLRPYLLNQKMNSGEIYFFTEDNPTEGSSQKSVRCQSYDPVIQPNSVEAVITFYKEKLWKLTHYYSKDRCANVKGITHELYNLTDDKLELNNLYDPIVMSEIQIHLLGLLESNSVLYRGLN